jgi:hypothetical protein
MQLLLQVLFSNLPITTTRQILGVPKSIQASVTLLENLHIIVEKTPAEDLQAEIFPMLFSSYESTTLQVQVIPACSSAVDAHYLFIFFFLLWSRRVVKRSLKCICTLRRDLKGNRNLFLVFLKAAAVAIDRDAIKALISRVLGLWFSPPNY